MDGKEEHQPSGSIGNSGETCDGCGWLFPPERRTFVKGHEEVENVKWNWTGLVVRK